MNIKSLVEKIVFENRLLYGAFRIGCSVKAAIFSRSKCKIENYGLARIEKDIRGGDNIIRVGKSARLYDTKILIHGNNNSVIFDEGAYVGPDCSFWIEGNNSVIHIGSGTTFTMGCHFCVQEDNMSITVGTDCMFSNSIIVRTSDSHPIYNEEHIRINCPHSVKIGNHVWIAPNVKIMKGVHIGDGTIIGSDTIVTKKVPAGVLAVGHPAKVVREKISWTREQLF